MGDKVAWDPLLPSFLIGRVWERNKLRTTVGSTASFGDGGWSYLALFNTGSAVETTIPADLYTNLVGPDFVVSPADSAGNYYPDAGAPNPGPGPHTVSLSWQTQSSPTANQHPPNNIDVDTFDFSGLDQLFGLVSMGTQTVKKDGAAFATTAQRERVRNHLSGFFALQPRVSGQLRPEFDRWWTLLGTKASTSQSYLGGYQLIRDDPWLAIPLYVFVASGDLQGSRSVFDFGQAEYGPEIDEFRSGNVGPDPGFDDGEVCHWRIAP